MPVDDQPRVYLGMGAKNLDLGAYFQFLFASSTDARFTPEYLIQVMQANGGGRMGESVFATTAC